MALSAEAEVLKRELLKAVVLKKALTTAKAEWQDILWLSEQTDEPQPLWAEDIRAEKHALQKELAAAQLHNFALIQKAALPPRQDRIMRLRYVQGLRWQEILERLHYTKQYILRQHNAALEMMVKRAKIG